MSATSFSTIPASSPLHRTLTRAAQNARVAVFVGLPGVGKSLWIRECVGLAHQHGREVHLLQWDVARAPFETPALLARYPEVDGVTHPVIRMAVGVWARSAVARWHQAHPEPRHLLLVEAPLIGHRLVELVRPQDDPVESLLASPQARFLLPVPSREVRQAIEEARAASIADPRHPRERADAPPNVLRGLWEELYQVAASLGVIPGPPPAGQPIPYDPEVYRAVFAHLLRHRHLDVLPVDVRLTPQGSVYELSNPVHELVASPEEATQVVARLVAARSPQVIADQVTHWYF